MQSREIKNAIQMGHFANLKKIAETIPEGDKDVRVIGWVIGKAAGVSFRANPQGSEPSIAITGKFEATPADTERAIMVAPAIFLPKAFSDILEKTLMDGKEKERPKKAPDRGVKPIDISGVAVIPLALEIGIRRSSGAVGYEFSVVQRGNDTLETEDDLAELRSLLPQDRANAAPAIEDKSKGKRKRK